MNQNLTEVQKRILDFIKKKKLEKGFPPSMAEIAQEFGYSTRATAQQHLEALEKKGFIKRNPRISRGIEVLDEVDFQNKPILGIVAAGNPLTIYPDAIDTVQLPNLVKIPTGSFLLKIKGNSLKDAYIFDGDIVVVKPNIYPQNGQIIVAILEDSAVIKKYIKKRNVIELHSENEEYKPIIISSNHSDFKIIGLVIGIYRSMDKRISG